MFCEIIDIDSFRSIFKKLSEIVENINFLYDSDGIRFTALDRSHSIFISVDMDMNYFDEYHIDEPGNFCLDCTELFKVLSRLKGNVFLEYDESNYNVTFRKGNDEDNLKKFTLHCIDDISDTPSVPELEYPFNHEFNFAYFKNMLKDLELYDDHFIFRVEDNSFKTISEGMMGKFTDTCMLEPEKIETYYQSKFSLNKFKVMLSADKISENIIINMGNDMPLKIDYEGFGINITYLLAPVIDKEE